MLKERKKEEFLSINSLKNFNCEALQEIDKRWLDYPKPETRHFGFSVQKKIWQNHGSPKDDSSIEAWRSFYIDVGWKTRESGKKTGKGYLRYDKLKGFSDKLASRKGNLPTSPFIRFGYFGGSSGISERPSSMESPNQAPITISLLALRTKNCNL